MADIPNIPGANPPPKQSDSKVLPKKETVRINLPPKPSAAPTIKLPTLPPGGPSTVSMSPPPPAPASRAAAAPASSAAAAPAQRPAAPSRPAPARSAPAPSSITGFDKVLAIAALVAVIAAIGSTVYLTFFSEWIQQ